MNNQKGSSETVNPGLVDSAVDIFYQKVLADERISHLFEDEGADGTTQGKDLLANSLVGQNASGETGLIEAKQQLNLTEAEFYAVVEHLASTLAEVGLEESDVAEVAEIAESIKSDVMAHK